MLVARTSKSTTDKKPEMAFLPAQITDRTFGCLVTSFDKKLSASKAGMGQQSTRKHEEEGAGHGGRAAITSEMLVGT